MVKRKKILIVEDDKKTVGLTIVKRLVEAHGGSTEMHNEKGRGSTFVFIVPQT